MKYKPVKCVKCGKLDATTKGHVGTSVTMHCPDCCASSDPHATMCRDCCITGHGTHFVGEK